MIKLHLFAVTLFITFNTLGQNRDLAQFDFKDYNFPKSLIIEVEGKNEVQLKTNIENWIDNYYSKTTLLDKKYEDNTFAINGKSIQLLEIKNLTTDLKYDLKISFRNQKYRIEVTSIYYKYYTEYRKIINVDIIKDSIIRNDLLESRSLISSFFNDLNKDLYNFITDQNNDW